MIQKVWTLVYIGSPDYLSVDQGYNYVSKEMHYNLIATGITII